MAELGIYQCLKAHKCFIRARVQMFRRRNSDEMSPDDFGVNVDMIGQSPRGMQEMQLEPTPPIAYSKLSAPVDGTALRRSSTDRTCLGAACVCCVTFFCAFLVVLFLGVFDHRGHTASEAETLQVAWMREHAARLKSMGDAHADPCVDFYQSVCGTWTVRTNIPNDSSSVTTFDQLQRANDVHLLEVLRQHWPFVGTWFDACEDVDARARQWTDALSDVFGSIGGMKATDLPVTLAALHLSDVPALFSVWFAPDERNVSRPTAMLSYPAMAATPEVWNSSASGPVVQRAMMMRLMTTLLGSAEAATQALNFERDWLAPAMLSAAQSYTAPTVWTSATPACGAFVWRNYWAALIGSSPPTEVGTRDPAYLNAVCTAVSNAPLEVVQNYLVYSVMLAYVDSFPNASGLLQPLREAVTGVLAERSLDEECLRSTEAAFPMLLGHYFSEEFFSDTALERATKMLDAVHAAMGDVLADSTWLDEPTRQAALGKLAAMQAFVGRPAEWSSGLPGAYVDESNYLANVLAYRRMAMAYNVALWTEPDYFAAVQAAPPGWEMPVFEVNAYYEPTENIIVFPEGIIGGVFFNESAPDAANYGALGAVMGHEISHAFDNQGRQYDAKGNRRDWWTPQASAAFDERAQCIVDLYSAFQTPYGPVDGKLTEGENIADSGGLALALQAYREHMRTMDARQRDRVQHHIRNIYGYDDEQLFFRAYATTWCGKRTPERAAQLLQTDPHAPSRARVNCVVSQSTDFLDAFKCKHRNATLCKVW